MHFYKNVIKIQEVSGQATPPALHAGAGCPVQRAKVCAEFAIVCVFCIGEFRTFLHYRFFEFRLATYPDGIGYYPQATMVKSRFFLGKWKQLKL